MEWDEKKTWFRPVCVNVEWEANLSWLICIMARLFTQEMICNVKSLKILNLIMLKKRRRDIWRDIEKKVLWESSRKCSVILSIVQHNWGKFSHNSHQPLSHSGGKTNRKKITTHRRHDTTRWWWYQVWVVQAPIRPFSLLIFCLSVRFAQLWVWERAAFFSKWEYLSIRHTSDFQAINWGFFFFAKHLSQRNVQRWGLSLISFMLLQTNIIYMFKRHIMI